MRWRRSGFSGRLSTKPGTTVLMRMPAAPSWSASILAKARRPGRTTEEVANSPAGSRAAKDDRITMEPPPWARIGGATARIRRSALRNIISKAARQSSSLTSSSGPFGGWPVLTTRPSIRPQRSSAPATRRSVSAGSVSEPVTPQPPSSVASRSAEPDGESAATRYPSAARRRTQPAPMPLPAAVTIATLSMLTSPLAVAARPLAVRQRSRPRPSPAGARRRRCRAPASPGASSRGRCGARAAATADSRAASPAGAAG